MHDPHVPAGAFGRPNVGGSLRLFSLIRCFFRWDTHQSRMSQKRTIGTNQFSQLLFGSILTPDTMVALDNVEVVIAWMCDHLSRGVGQRHGILFEFCPEVRNLEDAKARVSNGSRKTRRMARMFSRNNWCLRVSSCPKAVRPLVLITSERP